MAEELNNEKLQMPLLIIDSGVLTKSFQKPVSIGIVFKNVSSLNTPAYLPVRCTQTGDMMPRYPARLFWLDVACDFISTNK
jgi:hypothetical protein